VRSGTKIEEKRKKRRALKRISVGVNRRVVRKVKLHVANCQSNCGKL